MRRNSYLLFVVCLLTLLVVNPVLAVPGNGGGKGGSADSKTNGKGSDITVKVEKGVTNQKNNNEITKQTKNKVLGSMTETQINAVKEKIAQKRSETTKIEFKDTKGHWAQKNIDKVQGLGLISGYQGSFQPDSPVTSAEAMVMAVNLAETLGTDQVIEEELSSEVTEVQEETSTEVASDESTAVVSDVPEWASNQAKTALKLGIVNMNRFHSTVQASRAQTAVMLAKALSLEPVDTSGNTFGDSILISSEDLGYILALKEAGIVAGTPDGKFNPNSSITRAEIASMLEKSVEAAEGEEADTAEETPVVDETDGTVQTTTPSTEVVEPNTVVTTTETVQ